MSEYRHRINASLFVNTATLMEAKDYEHPNTLGRVIVLHLDDLTIHFGGGDEEVAVTIGKLQCELEPIRAAAWERYESRQIEERDNQIDAGLGTGYIGEHA